MACWFEKTVEVNDRKIRVSLRYEVEITNIESLDKERPVHEEEIPLLLEALSETGLNCGYSCTCGGAADSTEPPSESELHWASLSEEGKKNHYLELLNDYLPLEGVHALGVIPAVED